MTLFSRHILWLCGLLIVAYASACNNTKSPDQLSVTNAITLDGADGSKLTWERSLETHKVFANWYEAKEHCAKLGVPWRLPTTAELLYLCCKNQEGCPGACQNAIDALGADCCRQNDNPFWSEDGSTVSFFNGFPRRDATRYNGYQFRCVHVE